MPTRKTYQAGRLLPSAPSRSHTPSSRPPSQLEEYQATLAEKLSSLFPTSLVQTEWPAMEGESKLYSPKLDIAVGPFASGDSYIEEYDLLMDSSHPFIQQVLDCHLRNVRRFDDEGCDLTFDTLRAKNRNARCFLAIEIENEVNRKHLIGGAVNAAALGRIGLAIAWTDEKLRAFVKLRKYLRFLASVGKNTFDTTNLMIMSKKQFHDIVQDSQIRTA